MAKNRIIIALIALFPKEKFNLIGESQGICSIAGYLEEAHSDNVQVRIFDQQIHNDNQIISELRELSPDIIGYSVKMGTLKELEDLHNEIVEIFPNSIYCCGNSYAHFNESLLLEKYPNILISKGEGEIALGDLILYINGIISKNQIRNLVYYKDGKLVYNVVEYLNPNLIPISKRSNTKRFYDLGAEIYIEGSRGCAYCGCNICECKHFLGSTKSQYKWRPKESVKIVQELNELAGNGIKEVTFADEDFLGDIRGLTHAEEIADGIIDNNIQIKFRINCRVQSLRQSSLRITRLLNKLKTAGLIKIFLGFESGSATQLKRYGKGFSLNDFLQAYQIINSVGISCELGFIPFDPLMNFEELKETFKFIGQHSLINNLSAIIKTLRIQGGNVEYLNKVYEYESMKDIRIVDEYDPYTQLYIIKKFADERVDLIWKAITDYESNKYSDYYSLRIKTQYTEDTSFNQIINQVRMNDYDLMIELIKAVENNIDRNGLRNIVDEHANNRERLLDNILEQIRQ